MEGLSKSFFELDSAMNKAALSAQPRPIIEKTPVRSQEPDTYISKKTRKTKKPSMMKTNPIATIGLIIAGAFAIFKGKGKIVDAFKKLKDSKIGKSVADFVKKLPDTIKTKFPKISEKAEKIFKPVSEKAGKAWNFIKTKIDGALPAIKKIFKKEA